MGGEDVNGLEWRGNGSKEEGEEGGSGTSRGREIGRKTCSINKSSKAAITGEAMEGNDEGRWE